MSERTLDQQEVDALVRAIRDGEVATADSRLLRIREAEALDLTDPSWGQDRIVRRRLPVLDSVFDRLGPFLQVTLTKSLRFPVRTECKGVELQKFGDFRQQYHGSLCLFEVMRLDPLRGSSLILFEPTITYALIDALMGGLGVGEVPDDRDVSDIELSLLYKVYGDMLRDLENAWRPWFPLRVEHLRSDRSASVLATVSDEEVCHVATIVASGDVLPRSPIHFVLPYTSLEPLLEATSARVGDEIDPNWRVNLETNLRDVSATMTAVLGEATVSTRTVKNLQVGDVIELENRVDDDISINVHGEPIYTARMGRSNLQYAVRINERREIERERFDRTAGQVLVRKGLISHEQLQVARVDELVNRRPLLDSIVARGWVERRVLESALGN